MNDRLPNTSRWQPKRARTDDLKKTFFLKCKQIEVLTLARKEHEQQLAQYNFDSGPGVEDIVRDGIRELLPMRYHVTSGTLSDSIGYTAGDCDIVIFNENWFPTLKKGATNESRRKIMPIEGVYAVLEVKQTLDFKSLDAALEKLVMCHRLDRADSSFDRTTENREHGSCAHYRSNPLYSGIVATGLSKSLQLETIIERFIRINQSLPRRDVIRSLCVLGAGTVIWAVDEAERDGTQNPSKSFAPARFMKEDLYLDLHPSYSPVDNEGSALYTLATDLLSHLYHSILAPEDLAIKYGSGATTAKFPSNAGFKLTADPTLLSNLDRPCH